jgi:hypothetical protein
MSVADLLSQMAANAGRTQLARGALIGNAISSIAAVPGQILDDREKQQIVAAQQARLNAQDARGAAADARGTAKDARDAAQAQKDAADEAKKAQDREDRGAALTAGMNKTDPSQPWQYEPAVVEAMRRGRTDLAKEFVDQHFKDKQAAAPKTPTELAMAAADPTNPTQAQATTALDLSRPPKAEPVPKAIESKSVLLDGKPALVNYNPTTGRHALPDGTDVSTRVAPIPPAALRVNVGGSTDVKDAVAGMKDGTLPPQMPGRASKDYTAILAESRRQGFDLGKANLDWTATQKHVATMNGAQQLRLNQAINSLPDMLDKVDALATQWKGGKFPVLNKANLALAKGGAYGSDVASVANQLDAQIADVTADLGNVYMGGNSPTDHALGLAGKSLNGAWDEKVLHDMVKLAKTNVTIRSNSIKNTGVAGASDTNPYGNQPGGPPVVPPPAGGGGLSYQDYLKSKGGK